MKKKVLSILLTAAMVMSMAVGLSLIHILFFNGNDSGTAYCDFSVPAPKLPSASLFSSASQPMGISLCQNDLCILLFFNAFNWFINHETTKYHSHRSPVCQGF